MLDKQAGRQELKNVDDPDERMALLRNQLVLVADTNLLGKNVLLLDDLYRSGATLSVATEILYRQAQAKAVYVLTMTKTRSKR